MFYWDHIAEAYTWVVLWHCRHASTEEFCQQKWPTLSLLPFKPICMQRQQLLHTRNARWHCQLKPSTLHVWTFQQQLSSALSWVPLLVCLRHSCRPRQCQQGTIQLSIQHTFRINEHCIFLCGQLAQSDLDYPQGIQNSTQLVYSHWLQFASQCAYLEQDCCLCYLAVLCCYMPDAAAALSNTNV